MNSYQEIFFLNWTSRWCILHQIPLRVQPRDIIRVSICFITWFWAENVPESSGKRESGLKPTDRLQLYENLKPAEKYFFLLETFWTDTNWVHLQAEDFGTSPFKIIEFILSNLGEMTPGKKIRLRDDMRVSIYDIEYFFHYFSYFGFWEATPYKNPLIRKYLDRTFTAESITPTVFGWRLPAFDGSKEYIWLEFATSSKIGWI